MFGWCRLPSLGVKKQTKYERLSPETAQGPRANRHKSNISDEFGRGEDTEPQRQGEDELCHWNPASAVSYCKVDWMRQWPVIWTVSHLTPAHHLCEHAC